MSRRQWLRYRAQGPGFRDILFPVPCVLFLFFLVSCGREKQGNPISTAQKFLVVLGTAQDAGYPQIGCERDCCKAYWEGTESKKHITCLALVDNDTKQYWLFEATPDITAQLHNIQPYLETQPDYSPDGIFLTHAHIGHYSGLMLLGREAMGAKSVPVWALPHMDSFLRHNAPWSQLVSLQNIQLQTLKNDSAITFGEDLKVTPLKVPHRDEFSETAGYIIESNTKRVLFIPDTDKWEKWEKDIVEEIKKVDLALIDGTFYRDGELQGRDMREVPHPFVSETMQKMAGLPAAEKAKIMFIHFNHTNPLLKKGSVEKQKVLAEGFRIAEDGMLIDMP